jgi:hypothetical protein
MLKIIFVLVLNGYHGGVGTIDFTTLQQCEAAKAQIASETKKGATLGMTCIEKQVPLKKTKCRIINENYHVPHPGAHSGSGAMENFPYPVALECSEE